MQTHIPAYDDYTGQPTANPVDDPCIPQPARDAAYDGQDDSRWDDDQESSSRQGPSGMSVSSSEVPKEEESISAAEAAKSRSFRALRTAKACDICKIRKVKCDGGDPCAPCRVHNSICIYSKTTRKKLLSLSEINARNGQSVIPKNTRGRPMTTDFGNWTQGGRNGDETPGEPFTSYAHNMEIETTPTKRRRLSSELNELDGPQQSFDPNSGGRAKLPPLPSFSTHLGSGSRYPVHGQEVSREGDPYAVSNARSSRAPASAAKNSTPGTNDSSCVQGNGFPSATTSGFQEVPHKFAVPAGVGGTPGNSSTTKDTPSSIQAASAAAGFVNTAGSTPGSGSAQSGHPRHFFEYRPDNAFSSQHNGRDPMTSEEFQGSSRDFAYSKPSSATSGFTYATPTVLENGSQSRLRSQRSPSAIIGAEVDALGNAGITTFLPGAGANGLLWWGPTSFLSLQDRLLQVLKAQKGSSLEIDPTLQSKSQRSSGNETGSRSSSPGKGRTVWRWGCDKLIFRFDPPIDETAIPIDPMFLPSQLAHRFFHAFTVIVHPLYPVVDLDQVRGSISDAYAGSVNYRPDPATRPSEHTRNMHKARDFMVLALGAQIEGGDGDAHCPKEVARAWSKHLADQAHGLLTTSRENGVVDAIRIWLLYTVYLGNYGQVDEQYVAVGHAARLVTSLGLHREPTCNLSEPKDEGLRELFWTTYIMEKTISLWQGRPSSLNIPREIDTALPPAGEIKMNALRSMVDLVDTVEQVHEIYLNQNRDVTKQSAYNKVNTIFRELDVVRKSVVGELRGFESVDMESPGSLVALDTPEGERALFKFRLCLLYHNLRMLASLPLLSFLVWQGLTQQRASVDQQVLSDLAGQCVASAETTILAFNVYMSRIPYLPFMGDFTTMLLYAIPIMYLDSLRYDQNSIPRRNSDAMRLVVGVLQHFDHPAADVCKAMVQDLFDNHMHRPEWSNPSMQLQSSSMENPAGSNELMSWLTGPHDHGRSRPNPPQ